MLSQQWVIIGTYHKIGRWVDIPPIDCIYFFFPNSFDSTAIQAVGRSLRSFPWKETVHLYDWNDTPILKWQGSKRLQVYKTEYKQKAEDIKEIII
jgi:superfamily II DNA or RNA helicase